MIQRVLPLSLFLLLGACADSIVNGKCVEGFVSDGTRCVPIGVDSGTDSGVDSGLDAGVDSGTEAGLDSDVGDGAADSGVDGAADGALDAAVDGGTDAAADSALDAGFDAGFDAGMDSGFDAGCPVGFLECPGMCVDPMGSDPDNCGGCGLRCSSGICVTGVCADDSAAHVVVIGHDYEDSRAGMNRVAGNALFLASGTVDAAVFEGTASAASISGVDQAFNQRATEQTRTWNRNVVTAVQVPTALTTADALVILPQPGSSDAELTQLGMDWSAALMTFIDDGGVVVLFDTPSASNAGTWQILDAAGQFSATGIVDVSLDTVFVQSTNDSVALDVPPTYLGEISTVRFLTADPNVVIAHSSGPVVIHRVILP